MRKRLLAWLRRWIYARHVHDVILGDKKVTFVPGIPDDWKTRP
jgi:hypothetical protein